MKSRKHASTSSISKHLSSTSSISTAFPTTAAAAVSVTKFGQATFTSFRRKDQNENGNFVPLKKSKLDDDFQTKSLSSNVTNSNNSKQQPVTESKPKVYKFFKSRASVEDANNKSSSNTNADHRNSATRTPPVQNQLVLNNYTKQDGVKRITTSQTTYTRIKNDRNSSLQSSSSSPVIHKSITIDENKSCEIKILPDKTIKKIISPTKTTEFIIRNQTSNVRNATVKPNISTTPVQILPVNSRGLRSSRRLQGIAPESSMITRNTSSSTMHSMYDRVQKPQQSTNNRLTTLIEVAVDNEENQNIDDKQNTVEENDTTESTVEKNDDTFMNGNKNDNNNSHTDDVMESQHQIDSIENLENRNPETTTIDESSNQSNNNNNDNSENIIKSTQLEQEIETLDIQNSESSTNNNIEPKQQQQQIQESLITNQTSSIIDTMETKTSSTQQNGTKIDENDDKNNDLVLKNVDQSGGDQQTMIANNKTENDKTTNVSTASTAAAAIVIKPKKKIFSHRERNKVEFNTKSFFSSDLKDEFDMEMDKKSASDNTLEKKTVEKDDDDETYIKLKRIKKAHQCHELGETEQFDEDIKYYLSGIISSNPISMRCLSILGLTQQTMRPEFRMHLRAHDDMPRIMKALLDAPQDANMALCTACLMFVYNQDRLTMDIDPNALSLMLDLLETRSDECNQVEERHRNKVRSLVEEMKNKGHAQYLKLNEITAGKLAMETLLGLTSKRAGDWFKVELKKMKGIDFIVDTVIRCAEGPNIGGEEDGQMVKIDRCMHVLENVTFNNVENQLYVTNYNDSKFISTCISLLIECKNKIISSNDSKIFLSAFFSILRVLTNLTSESVEGCKIVGTFDGVIDLLLESLFELPTFIMSDQRFDLMVIIFCLCINLAEFCQHIRDIIMNSTKYMSKLSELLFKKIEEAEQVEQQTDHLLESHETVQMTEAMQDNLLMQMISKSGTHMEHSLISACVCLLFGCCIQDNDNYKNSLKATLPNNSFKPLIEQLEKLRDFAHLADIMTQKGKERVQKVLQLFKLHEKNSTNDRNDI